MNLLENVQLCYAYMRIVSYMIYSRLFLSTPDKPKKTFEVLCLGTTGAGKTSLLHKLSGNESSEDDRPTNGFLIQALQFKRCYITTNEIGGGKTIRPYWSNYFSNMGRDGILYMIDGSLNEDLWAESVDTLRCTAANAYLKQRKWMVFVNTVACEVHRSQQQIEKDLNLPSIFSNTDYILEYGNINEIESVRNSFEKYSDLLFKKEIKEEVKESDVK